MPSRWTYSNWITLEGSARLTQLRLHIQEVSDFVQGMSSRHQSATAVDTNYLQTLLNEEKELSERLAGGGAGGGFGKNNLRLVRD